ncbi:MAG: zinc-dependent alcohol dehydrogenase family protein [Thermoflavifilum sp.]|jgi:alcohol dehydrogenase|uniref:zinc-dependent alcohol dehydrogenase family protein n=1 Tax=Thermoflavifilum sp. TaxID=1968839 RepID=UPI0018A3C346|nr:zinc-dependent alcohol dehydrogenase family protein [Thermoflavifilum sp.]QOR75931.1 MAG: zinc-dependent alcohol dehydrogenase family protein [Thermoflavifilum sp.]
MKAIVYHGPGNIEWEDKPRPVILEDTDVIVRITKTTICGTDLHILKGDVPEVTDGRILGHEGVGIVEEAGKAVRKFKPGDHVLISCITSCGSCAYCRKGMYSHCENGGWMLGHLIDGTQAEYVRIPYADYSLYHIPQGLEEEALVMLSDILPTGFECGVLNGEIKPGDNVVIVGAGPVGLAALLTAQFYSPGMLIAIDMDENRLEIARKFGADYSIHLKETNPIEVVKGLTQGKGADVVIEAVGVPESFELCQSLIAPGGIIANIGVHGKPVTLHMEKLWSHNIKITTRLVDTVTIPLLLKTVQSGKLTPEKLITHHFKLYEGITAYQVFKHASAEKALKVILSAES